MQGDQEEAVDAVKKASMHFTNQGFSKEEVNSNITSRAKEILEADNQLYRELLNVNSLDPFTQHATSPRKQMGATQVSQSLVIAGSSPRTCVTGMERRYGDETFKIKADEDLEVIRLIERYPHTYGEDVIPKNPQTIVIYEEVDTKRVGCIDLVDFCSHHSYFGFRYKNFPAMNKLRKGSFIKKGEVFRDSPSVQQKSQYHQHPDYYYGVEANVVDMTLPGTAEDGNIISESMAKKLAYKTYETRIIEVSETRVPIMIYPGDKIFPEIGEMVRPDGLLMAIRTFNPRFLTTVMYEHSPHALRTFHDGFDRPIYVPPGGRVIDIKVTHDSNNTQNKTLFGMDSQLVKYHQATIRFHKEILEEYKRLKAKRGGKVEMTPQMQQLVYRAYLFTYSEQNKDIQFSYKTARIEDWRIEFIIEYDNIPDRGFKMAGTHGNKATVIKVLPDEQMPVDQNGNRADVIRDPLAIVARSILGCAYEPKYTATLRDLVFKITKDLNVIPGKITPESLEVMDVDGKVMKCYQKLMHFYKIISPEKVYEWMAIESPVQERYRHLANVINGKRKIYLPPENQKQSPQIVKELNEHFPNFLGPITYVGNSGKSIKTKEDVLIGTSYILGLDKTGMDYAAVNIGRLQHHGLLAQLNNTNKYSSQVRQQPPRFTGESENRILVATTDPETVAELTDRSGNRETMYEMVEVIINADNPMNIQELIDRRKIPFGNNRPLQIQQHSAECFGYKFEYSPYEPKWGGIKYQRSNRPLIYPDPVIDTQGED